jgi:programmed cell death protein 6
MFDSNGDSQINYNEFTSLWQYVNDWTRCFRSIDKDNSGNIDKGELTQALNKFGKTFLFS